MPVDSAHERAVHAGLAALGSDPLLSRDFVLKGGLALQLIYGSPRQSEDIDLSSAKPFTHEVTDEKNEMLLAFCELMDASLSRLGGRFRLHDLRMHEKTLSKEIPALFGSIGYRSRRNGKMREVKMQVTLSEMICETARQQLRGFTFHVAGLEDILADKLKAILQQVTRNKLRPMDVYDVWYFAMVSDLALDLARLREYLEIKTARWPEVFPPTAARFHEIQLRENSAERFPEYVEALQPEAPRVSFEDAFAGILSLVDRLELPELVGASGRGQ